MATRIDEAFVELKARDEGLEASLNRIATRLDTLDRKGGQNLSNLDSALRRVRNSVLTMATAWGAWKVGRGIVEAGMQVQAMQNRMVAATGDARIAGESLAFVRAEANRLGLDIRDTANGFSGFAAASLRAGLTLQQTKEIFTGVSEAAVSMRLPSEQVQLVFKALEQMAGKGVVSMEELRGQLGDALPGAFEIAAKAMGKTTAEFSKMVANGEVMSADFLPRFGAAVRKELGGSVDEASKGAQAAFNRMGNAFFELQSKMANSGFLDAITRSVEDLTDLMNDPDTIQGLQGFAGLLGDIVISATKAASALGNFYTSANNAIDSMGDSAFSTFFGKEGADAIALSRKAKANGISEDAQRAIDAIVSRGGFSPSGAVSSMGLASEGGWAGEGSALGGNYTLGTPPKGGEDKTKEQERAAKQAQQLRERLAEQAQSLRYGFAEPEEQAAMDVERQQEFLRDALEAKAITEQEFRDLSLESEMAYQDTLKEIREKAREEELTALEGFLGARIRTQAEMNDATLSEQGASFAASISQAAKHNQIFFAIEKARALASALISARESVVHAYNFGSRIGGPPLGAVFAGVAAAAQAANIAAIASSSYNSSAGSVSSAGSGGSAQTSGAEGATAGPTGATKSVYITLNGDESTFYSKTQVRKLVESLNDVFADGTQLKLAVSA